MDKILWNKSIDLLSRRDHSAAELRRKLGRWTDEVEIIEKTIDRLEENSFLDDRRFCENYVGARIRRGFGSARILLELKNKGIASQLTREILSEIQVDWDEKVFAVWEKKYRGCKPQSLKEHVKQSRFLQSRGFSSSQINQLFANIKL